MGALAYLQTLAGYEVKADMPGLEGSELIELHARRAAWLDGSAGIADTLPG